MAASRVAFKANSVFGLAGTVFPPPNFFGVAKAMPPAITDAREPVLTEKPSEPNARFTPLAFHKRVSDVMNLSFGESTKTSTSHFFHSGPGSDSNLPPTAT